MMLALQVTTMFQETKFHKPQGNDMFVFMWGIFVKQIRQIKVLK
jgi:hypothetical protein